MRIAPSVLTISLAVATSAAIGPASAAAPAETKAVRLGRLVDGTGRVVDNAVVVVANGRIKSVGSGDAAVPKGVELLDLRRYTGIPGLIDAHTHMTFYYDPQAATGPWNQIWDRRAAVTVFLAQENARKALEVGVTTVRDLGALEYGDIAMRDLINRGAIVGPRMFVSGYGLMVTYEPFRPGSAPADGGVADGVPEVLRAVRRQIAAGADVIKMYGSTGSAEDLSGRQTFTFEEMKAAADMAHQAGRRIAIHSYGPEGARDAVRAGADSVEHAVDIDDETLAEMVRRGTFYVPTVDHNRYYAEAKDLFGLDQQAVDRFNAFIQRNVETVRRAHKAGVRIAMGSDAVFTMFGQNTRELLWLVKAGMTPKEALATATTNGATLLGMEKRLGAVAPGYDADLVAVEGDPLADVGVVIDKVRWVMKAGVVVVDRTKPARSR